MRVILQILSDAIMVNEHNAMSAPEIREELEDNPSDWRAYMSEATYEKVLHKRCLVQMCEHNACPQPLSCTERLVY